MYRDDAEGLRLKARELERQNAELRARIGDPAALVETARLVRERDWLRQRVRQLEDTVTDQLLDPPEPRHTSVSRFGSALLLASLCLALAQQWWWFAGIALVGAALIAWGGVETPREIERDTEGMRLHSLQGYEPAAQRTIVIAQQLARQLQHSSVSGRHLMLALVRDRDASVVEQVQQLVLAIPTSDEWFGLSSRLMAHMAVCELVARGARRRVRVVDLWHAMATDPSPEVADLAAEHSPC